MYFGYTMLIIDTELVSGISPAQKTAFLERVLIYFNRIFSGLHAMKCFAQPFIS